MYWISGVSPNMPPGFKKVSRLGVIFLYGFKLQKLIKNLTNSLQTSLQEVKFPSSYLLCQEFPVLNPELMKATQTFRHPGCDWSSVCGGLGSDLHRHPLLYYCTVRNITMYGKNPTSIPKLRSITVR